MGQHTLERTIALIEDVEFMVRNGAGWLEICERTGRTPRTLERLLERNDQYHLVKTARARDDRAYI